jgi:hypothetical protein
MSEPWRTAVAEVLIEYPQPIVSEDGRSFTARACGSETPEGLWQGWVEFEPLSGGTAARTARETTQPNRADTLYWATGLTTVYLEGALRRALHPLATRRPQASRPPLFDHPAPGPGSPAADAVLNPFAAYLKGETLLRRQLAALSSWHLANIIKVHEIATGGEDPDRLSPSALVEIIVTDVKHRTEILLTDRAP